jgi:hypothetical protein
MKRNISLQPPALTPQEAEAIGREASLNRWRARMLRVAARAIGAVLDGNLPERTHDDLLNALVACVWWELEFTAQGG